MVGGRGAPARGRRGRGDRRRDSERARRRRRRAAVALRPGGPAEQIERAASGQYRALLQQAASRRALAPESNAQLQRLRAIAARIIPFTHEWNPQARHWSWEVNLIGSSQVNAFCMPGGKIAFYYGILDRLKLSDDEVAMVMGHEITHALREHAREQMGKTFATRPRSRSAPPSSASATAAASSPTWAGAS
jgi:Zn-dependent protease with chaperone function